MRFKQRFEMSQKAHKRLHDKHSRRMKRQDSAWVPSQYHLVVYDRQRKSGRILDKQEREKIFGMVVRDYND